MYSSLSKLYTFIIIIIIIIIITTRWPEATTVSRHDFNQLWSEQREDPAWPSLSLFLQHEFPWEQKRPDSPRFRYSHWSSKTGRQWKAKDNTKKKMSG